MYLRNAVSKNNSVSVGRSQSFIFGVLARTYQAANLEYLKQTTKTILDTTTPASPFSHNSPVCLCKQELNSSFNLV
jgi:hypothetical protein